MDFLNKMMLSQNGTSRLFLARIGRRLLRRPARAPLLVDLSRLLFRTALLAIARLGLGRASRTLLLGLNLLLLSSAVPAVDAIF